MTLEQAIFIRMSANAPLVALVPATAINPMEVTQGTALPYVAYFRVSNNDQNAFNSQPTLTETRIQFSCFGATYSSVKAIAAALVACFRGFTGNMGSGSGPYVSSCLKDSESDDFERDSKTFIVNLDFTIFHDAV